MNDSFLVAKPPPPPPSPKDPGHGLCLIAAPLPTLHVVSHK